MRPLRWTKAHEVYLPQIDAEHRNLFQTADELHRAILCEADSDQVQAHLGALISSVEEHFTHEERLMRSVGYPSFAWHKRQHDGVRRTVKELASRIEQGDPAAPTALLKYLSEWLRDHTGLTDRMMGAYLRNYERRHAALAS